MTRTGATRTQHVGFTRNISSTGVLFVADQRPDLGVSIEYVITLDAAGARSVHLRCVGTVVRWERELHGERPAYSVAATISCYEFVRSG